ncbi:MAG: methylated-DNA--[protein]-cysteine S-methyltransferase [Ignavibacteria bacterium]
MQIVEKIFYNSPLGLIKITANEKGITEINFVNGKRNVLPFETSNKFIKDCIKQLDEYFQGKRKTFNLQLNPYGTDFQKKVWFELLRIPYGKTISYGEVARKIKNFKAVRAVGQAIGKNPIAIVIPCHRVIGSDGSLIGYASGLHRKQWLLKHEGIR